MRKILVTLLMLTAVPFIIGGCEDDDNNPTNPVRIPAAPQGVYSVTGDGQVTVFWNGPYESNITEYVVYRSLDSTTGYTEIGTVAAVANPDLDLLIYNYTDANVVNGQKYYYAVSSVNSSGYESELSAEDVFDTPRPDGTVTLQLDSARAGFSFATATRVAFDNPAADVFIDLFDGTMYLNAANSGTDIQDMGYTDSFDDISYAPSNGWSTLGYVEAIEGHTYVVRTTDDNYAKVRITNIALNGDVSFDWGYQTATGNPELIAPLKPTRPVHSDNFLKKQSTSTRSAE